MRSAKKKNSPGLTGKGYFTVKKYNKSKLFAAERYAFVEKKLGFGNINIIAEIRYGLFKNPPVILGYATKTSARPMADYSCSGYRAANQGAAALLFFCLAILHLQQP